MKRIIIFLLIVLLAVFFFTDGKEIPLYRKLPPKTAIQFIKFDIICFYENSKDFYFQKINKPKTRMRGRLIEPTPLYAR